jgi:hypothetical protein
MLATGWRESMDGTWRTTLTNANDAEEAPPPHQLSSPAASDGTREGRSDTPTRRERAPQPHSPRFVGLTGVAGGTADAELPVTAATSDLDAGLVIITVAVAVAPPPSGAVISVEFHAPLVAVHGGGAATAGLTTAARIGRTPFVVDCFLVVGASSTLDPNILTLGYTWKQGEHPAPQNSRAHHLKCPASRDGAGGQPPRQLVE